jgi:hypothetical protein
MRLWREVPFEYRQFRNIITEPKVFLETLLGNDYQALPDEFFEKIIEMIEEL